MPRKDTLILFLTGSYSCAGKGLAMMELRSVMSMVVNEFDVVLEKFDEAAYWEVIKDHFTAGAPRCEVNFVGCRE